MESTTPLHSIQAVANRTRLSPHVIRAWERRYQAVSPHRASHSAHRLYSEEDITRLMILRQLTEAGFRISDIASLATPALLELRTELGNADPPSPSDVTATLIAQCLEAVEQADQIRLAELLDEAATRYTLPLLISKVFIPLLKQVGDRWHAGTLRVSHEHLATATVRSMLARMHQTSNMHHTGPVLIAATPHGQNHELGAMMAAALAASDGWQTIYLAPNLPATEIANIVKQRQARVLALSITYPKDDQHLADELSEIHRLIPEDVTVIVGGGAMPSYQPTLSAIGAIQVDSFSNFRQQLASIRDRAAL